MRRVWTRDPLVLDTTGPGAGPVFTPWVCGFENPKRHGAGVTLILPRGCLPKTRTQPHPLTSPLPTPVPAAPTPLHLTATPAPLSTSHSATLRARHCLPTAHDTTPVHRVTVGLPRPYVRPSAPPIRCTWPSTPTVRGAPVRCARDSPIRRTCDSPIRCALPSIDSPCPTLRSADLPLPCTNLPSLCRSAPMHRRRALLLHRHRAIAHHCLHGFRGPVGFGAGADLLP